MATAGISEEEEKLLQALHLLGIKPHLGSVEDVTKLMKVFTEVKSEPESSFEKETAPKLSTYQYPKLSIFFWRRWQGRCKLDFF